MDVLLLSGLPSDEIRTKNVLVGTYKKQDVHIRTIICGSGPENQLGEKKPILVLVHGYGGSGALFYKIIKRLTEYFHLILIDIIGMGASSRPDNYDASKFTPEQSIDYFVNYLESWRKEMDLTDFYLAGHSFGGYLVGNYASLYHQHLRKVIMLSPIGVINKFNPEDKTDELVQKFLKDPNGPPMWLRRFANWGWSKNISPFSIARLAGKKNSIKIIEGYVQKRQNVDND